MTILKKIISAKRTEITALFNSGMMHQDLYAESKKMIVRNNPHFLLFYR